MSRPWRDKQILESLYHNEGNSIQEIADSFGCDSRTVWKWMDKHDIDRETAYQDRTGPWQNEANLREEYIENEQSAGQLADKWGVDKKTILNWMKRFGIPTRPKKSEIDRGWRDADYMRELYNKRGLSINDIAEKLETDSGTIVRWMSRHGIETDPQLPPSGPDHPKWIGGAGNYRGENWGQQRRAARRRDQHRCQICRKTSAELGREPSVHHITPYRSFDSSEKANELDNLITLCQSCHRKTESMAPLVPVR